MIESTIKTSKTMPPHLRRIPDEVEQQKHARSAPVDGFAVVCIKVEYLPDGITGATQIHETRMRILTVTKKLLNSEMVPLGVTAVPDTLTSNAEP